MAVSVGDARTTSRYPPRNLNLITCASSNTDMAERSYVRGANGPRHLGIVLVEGRAGAPACVPGQAGGSLPANTGGDGMPTYRLRGQAALVTGAASGIGLVTAAMLGRGGACVAVNVLLDDPCGIEACGRH